MVVQMVVLAAVVMVVEQVKWMWLVMLILVEQVLVMVDGNVHTVIWWRGGGWCCLHKKNYGILSLALRGET